MPYNVIDGLATAATQPVTVLVINEGPGIWGNVATGLITATAAIAAVMLTHRYTLWREKQSAVQELKREQHFISTELIFLLEQYAEGCAQIAADNGEEVQVAGKQPERKPGAEYPVPLDFDKVAGDWRSLPARRMFRIRELPLRQAGAMRAIAYAYEHDSPGEYPECFRARQYEFAQLGITALFEARQLRRLCNQAHFSSSKAIWSAQAVMVDVYKRERARQLRNRKHDASLSDDI